MSREDPIIEVEEQEQEQEEEEKEEDAFKSDLENPNSLANQLGLYSMKKRADEIMALYSMGKSTDEIKALLK